MEYIIASHKEVLRQGWQPASAKIVEGRVILNENELRYRYPELPLEESAAMVDGTVVTRQEALDFISGTQTYEQIKTSHTE